MNHESNRIEWQNFGIESQFEFFHLLAEKADDLIFCLRLDPSRCFAYVNPAARRMLGYAPEEFYADPDLIYKRVHPDDFPLLEAARENYSLYSKPMNLRFRRKDGSQFWGELRGYVFQMKDSSDLFLEGRIRDISQEIVDKSALLTRNDELQTFYKISEIVSQAESLDEAYFQISDVIRAAIKCPIVAIELYDDEHRKMVFRGYSGFKPSDTHPFIVDLEETYSGRVAASGKPVVLKNMSDEPESRAPFIMKLHLKSYVGFPMILNGKTIGVISFGSEIVPPVDDRFLEWGQSLSNFVAAMTERLRTEEALVKSERRYKALFSSSHAAMLLIDPSTGEIVEVNPSDCEFYGYSEAEFRRMKISDINQLSREEIEKKLREASVEKVHFFRFPHRLKSGEIRTVEIHSGPIEIDDRQLLCSIIHDISDQVKAESALLDSERRYRDLTEAMPFILWRSDPSGAVDYCNKEWHAFTGQSEEETNGITPLKAIHPDDHEKARIAWLKGNESASSYSVEFRLRRFDGEYRWFQGKFVPIFNAERKIVRWYGSALDITDQREARESLSRSERRFRAMFEQAEIGFAHLDLDGNWLLINQKLCDLTGFDQDELMNRTINDLYDFVEERTFIHEMKQIHSLLLAEIDEWSEEKRILRKDGERIWIYATLSVARDENGVPLYFIVVMQDINERKLAEAALEESNRLLQDALSELREAQRQVIRQERLRALGQMASGIAHDFNNALMPIIGFSELLLQRPERLADEEKTRRYLNLILTGAQGAARTVNRLREFYRKPGANDERSPVDLRQLAIQAIDLTEPKWKDEAQANNRSIIIRTEFASTPRINGDESDLREAIVNLIFNAIDAMPQGGILDMKIRREDGHMVLAVSDTGVGMSEETREKCLEPFFTTKEERGTGLGLSIVHGIVTRHGGEIEIESEEGRGTTFRLRFPVLEASARERNFEPPLEEDLKPLRILLAEDDSSIREYLTTRLSMEGHRVTSARDGRMGWDLYRRGEFDLVITDHSMPRMSGEELAKRVKEAEADLPTLMLTGFGEIMIGKNEKPEAVDLILGKPIRFEDLKAGIASLLHANS